MNENVEQSILGVFFTYAVSLETWKKQGMLLREVSLYRELAKRPFQKVYFFTYGLNDEMFAPELKKYNIFVCPKKSRLPNFLYSFLLPFFYKKELRECSVYKTTQLFGSWASVIAKWLYKKPLVVRAGFALSTNLRGQGYIARSIAQCIERLGVRNATAVIVTTEAIKNIYSLYNKNITVIPNFVDTKLFLPTTHLQGDTVKILFVGRLSYEKNLESLIAAVKDNAKYELTLIGDGPDRKKLEAASHGSAARIVFLGSVQYEKLPEYFGQADIFVLPSLFEGHPKVLVEAMAAGLPIVATNVRGICTLIQENVTGVLVGTSSEEIRQGIEEVVKNDVLRESLKRNARAFAEKEFGFDTLLEQEQKLYLKFI